MSFLTMQNDILSDLNGLPRSLVKRGLNSAYQDLVRKWPYVSMEQTFRFGTTADYSSSDDDSTIAATVGSATITGTSTTFTAAMVGMYIRLNGEDQFYKITARASNTSITINQVYVGSADLSGDDFDVFQHIYELDSTIKELVGVTYDRDLTEATQEYLNNIDPARTSSGTPTHFSIYGKGDNGYLQIELWPHPTTEILLSYYGTTHPSTLSSDSDTPLITEDVIVDKARIDLSSAYLRIRPEDAKMITAFLPVWREKFFESEASLISEDNRIRSARESTRDIYGGSEIPGAPFWLDRNSL